MQKQQFQELARLLKIYADIYAVPMAELIVPPKHLYFLGFFTLTLEMEAQPHLHTGSVDGMYMEFICNSSLFSKLALC